MIVHNVFAQIFEGTVQNIVVGSNYPETDYITKCIYGNDAFAVNCMQFPCAIGDKYHDGLFWTVNPETNEEIRIEYIPTLEQQVQNLKSENNELTIVMAEMIGGLL